MKSLPWWGRRLITVPSTTVAWLVSLALSPLAVVAAITIDGVRLLRSGTKPVAWRLLGFLITYLTVEVLVILACLVIWLATGFGASRKQMVDLTYALQRWWANVLWDAACAIFRLRLHVEGADVASQGPVLALARHASIVDNILPFQLFTREHGTRLRYVIKKELLIDPSLDIAGNWLPNHFIERGGTDTESEMDALRRIATDLGVNEAVVIFPEGTRFSKEKQQRALAILAKRNPRLHKLAKDLRRLLPPRPGGVLTLLEAARADVVVVAHHGLDGFAQVKDIWSGGMVGAVVRVKMWRIPFEAVPSGRAERAEWLFRTWQKMDAWLEAVTPSPVTDG